MTKKILDEKLAEITDERRPPSQWHVEILEARGVVEHLEQGREKLRKLKGREKNDPVSVQKIQVPFRTRP